MHNVTRLSPRSHTSRASGSVSFILAWICFTVHVMCGLGFLYTSGKKKKRTQGTEPIPGLDEDEDENDEPFIMGR